MVVSAGRLAASSVWPLQRPESGGAGRRERCWRRSADEGGEDTADSTTWHEIVRNYSTRRLTKQTDRLVAISGLARETQKLLGNDAYVVDMWRSNLLNSLLWTLKESRECELAPDSEAEYIVPSWTWAARNGIVDFLTPELDNSNPDSELQLSPTLSALDLRSKATVLGIDIALALSDPFGQVTAGRLTLSSSWCAVRLEATSPAATYVRRRENAVAYVRWAQTLLPGIDVSSCRFTLAFSDDAKETLCNIGPDGTISFSK